MDFRRVKLQLLSLLFLFPFLSWSLSSSQTFKSARSRVRLISNVDSIDGATKSFYLALHFKLSKNWHVYWKNSGDSGTPPELNWEGSSADLKFSPILWPAPKRISAPPLMTYGYDGEVVFPVRVELSNLDPKRIKLKANWLICKVECIPESQTFEMKLGFSNESTVAEESALIQRYLAKSPEKIPTLSFDLTKDANFYHLKVKSPVAEVFAQSRKAYFFSDEGLRVKHAAEQTLQVVSPHEIILSVGRDENDDDTKNSLGGVLEIENEDGNKQYVEFIATNGISPFEMRTFLFSVLFAFLGGLLLNLMPCVFPVLFLKLYALTKNQSLSDSQKRLQAWAYGAGVVLSFLVLALVLIILKSVGLAVGWGFQLQSPAFVAAAFLLFVAMGLSLMGLYEFGGAFVGSGQPLTQKSGAKGSFFTGILATLVATPCSAPFMGSAVGYALTRSSWESFLVFTFLGAGLAFPYILLAYFPILLKWIPKPGVWMERIKEFFAFALFGTALWLLWILSTQQNSNAIVSLLVSALLLGLLLWSLRISSKKIRIVVFLPALVGAIYFYKESIAPVQNVASTHDLKTRWEDFSPEKLDSYLKENRAVFIDFTASWCLTCQVNKKLVLDTPDANFIFDSANVKLMRADWTNYDPEITQALAKLGRQSVPVYAYYPAGKKDPILLSELLSIDILKSNIITNKED